MRQKIAIIMVLSLLLIGCNNESAKIRPAFEEDTSYSSAKSTPSTPSTAPAKVPEPISSGVSSNIAEPSSGPGIKPTGKTRNFIMTIEDGYYNPNILTVIPGDRIKITLTNEDSVDHTFILSEFGINKVIAKGETAVIDFTPLKQGEFAWTEKDGRKQGTLIVEFG